MSNSDRPDRRHKLREIAHRAMRERGLEPDFPAEALAETQALAERPALEGDIRDLRELLWCSIDNDDSRDLDQLTVAEPGDSGSVRILVAIADVDERVRPGSAIDQHARTNTTSVYTAAEIFPMLPERLSTDLTSLNEGQERLAVVAALDVDASGTVTNSEVLRARVLNRAKLAYDSVAAWLDGTAAIPPAAAAVPGLDEQIRLQDRVAAKMSSARRERGALTLETRQVRPVFDGDVLADLAPDEKNRAKDLIADFMIAANGATARFLESRSFPSLRRVLGAPKRWDRIVALASEVGDSLPSEADGPALERFLVRRRKADPESFADLSLAVIKLLGSGEYAPEMPGQLANGAGSAGVGHFGLAARDYTHSTAPNRRYPDLITQRLVKAALAGEPVPYSPEELTALARHCTLQEDNAVKVERQVAKSAAALLLSGRHGEHFDAIVTGASEKGTWVRISRPTVEGKVIRGESGLDVGDRVKVKLVDTDIERGFIDFVKVG